jgi:Fur family ferric uptake transcriptional regulator
LLSLIATVDDARRRLPVRNPVSLRHDPITLRRRSGQRCRLEAMAGRGGEALAAQATALLRASGQRVTRPRVALLSCVIAAGEEHLSADTLLDQVAGSDPPIHRATVYRTLEGLTDAGVLRHVHLERGLTAYHLVDAQPASAAPHRSQHLHAQCSRCGRVTDLPAHVLGDTPERIRRASGFRLDASHVALSGICRECAAATST